MTEHLTDVEIWEVAAGESTASAVAAHAATCAACAENIAATRRALASLERLEPAVEPSADVDLKLARRLDALSRQRAMAARTDRLARSARWPARAAAAAIFFAAGVAAHAAWAPRHAPPEAVDPPAADTPWPLAVQREGTEYVASIARMVADSSRLSSDDRRAGREVVLAAMSGAAFELRLLGGADGVADDLHRVVERARRGAAAGPEDR